MSAIAGALVLSLTLLQLPPVGAAHDDTQVIEVAARKTAPRKKVQRDPGAEASKKPKKTEESSGLSLPGPLDNAIKEISADNWVGDEDLLFVFQSFCALGAASAVGAVSLLPAHAIFFGALLFLSAVQPSLSSGAAPIVAVPILLIAITLGLQAAAVGFTLWGVGLTSEHFKAPSLAPAWLYRLVGAGGPVVTTLIGQQWVPGALGYLVGAGIGMGVGLTLAVPIVAASLAVFVAPVGNIPGTLALMAGLTAGAVVLAAAETLIAPPIAALAWHFSKVPVDEPKADAR